MAIPVRPQRPPNSVPSTSPRTPPGPPAHPQVYRQRSELMVDVNWFYRKSDVPRGTRGAAQLSSSPNQVGRAAGPSAGCAAQALAGWPRTFARQPAAVPPAAVPPL